VIEPKSKDCPKCGHRESMIISIRGYLCLWCFYVEKFNTKEVDLDSGSEKEVVAKDLNILLSKVR